MKTKVKSVLFALSALFALSGAASGQTLKVGTVDVQRALKSYYKFEQGNQELERSLKAAQSKFSDKVATRQSAITEIGKLNVEIDKPELSRDAKQTKSKLRDEKIADLKTLDSEIQTEEAKFRNELNTRKAALLKEMFGDVMKVVDEKVKNENYQLVLDKSAGGVAIGSPVILYANKDFDFTDEVIAILNKSKPKEEVAAKAESVSKDEPASKPKKK
jgi:Skp family chaperone for outer membrane proteins